MGWPVVAITTSLRPSRDGFQDLARSDDASTSLARQAAADAWIDGSGERSIDDVIEAMRDHSAPAVSTPRTTCRRSAAHETVAAVAMDLTAGSIWITEGPPCTAAAERFEVGSLIARAA